MDEQSERRSVTSPTHDNIFLKGMRRDIQQLATLVATATYAAGFNMTGGTVWQESNETAGHLLGDPIMRSTDYRRYVVFFYCNATAFASSLMVFVLLLLLTARRNNDDLKIIVLPLRGVMLLDLLSFIGAYAAGTCRDMFSAVYYSLLVAALITYIVVHKVMAFRQHNNSGVQPARHYGEVLMLLATFALAATYVAGLSTPGGFWDHTEGGHRPGDAILKDHHDGRLTVFFVCNTTAFVASLLTIVVLLNRKRSESVALCCSIVALIGLVGAFTAGSCRETNTTVYVACLCGAIPIYIVFHVVVSEYFMIAIMDSCFWIKLKDFHTSVLRWLQTVIPQTQAAQDNDESQQDQDNRTRQIRGLIQLLATLAVTITYQAGLDPPGGLWHDNGDGHKAGDPILLKNDPKRYEAFFYCNSIAFVASLVAIILVQDGLLVEYCAVEATVMLELLGLIGAYAIGSCRDANTSIYVMCLAGAAVVYVVLHVTNFALNRPGNNTIYQDDAFVGRMARRLLFFSILVANITYQAGLTPPGGFLLQDDEFGHHAGDPVMLHNYPRRYKAYFYCNSVSFMLSIAQILVLVNPALYKPAIRSHALSICTAVSFISLMCAFAAGVTQHLKTSIYVFVLLAAVFLLVVLLLLAYFVKANTGDGSYGSRLSTREEINHEDGESTFDKQGDLMTLGILVASVAYQAGLVPPGGAWHSSRDGHDAGNPVMHDNRRHRYLAFFYSNTISFVASIFLVILALPNSLELREEMRTRWLSLINITIVLEFLGLLVGYAVGSSRQSKTSMYVGALVITVLAYVAIRVMLRLFMGKLRSRQENSQEQGDQL